MFVAQESMSYKQRLPLNLFESILPFSQPSKVGESGIFLSIEFFAFDKDEILQ